MRRSGVQVKTYVSIILLLADYPDEFISQVYIKDLGSVNGTYLDGLRVREPKKLQSGNVLVCIIVALLPSCV